MPSPRTSDEFLDLVRKSGLLDEKRLSAFLAKLGSGPPAEPQKLAGLFVKERVLTQFQADQLLQGRWRRFSLGKYKVLDRIGTGGMGSVFLCEHKLMRRQVAVKVLPEGKAKDTSALDRFYREARAVAALDHPNIVRAYDIDQVQNLHFLVMEYVNGLCLQDLVKKHGALEPAQAASYIRQAALGLQHAHEVADIVHRDVKPANLIVDQAGVVKVLDMGLARFFKEDDDQITKIHDENVLGTADYLAPEQALDSHGVDIRADIYSLGATFYYCLTGQTAFTEGTVAQKLIWHQTRQPRPIESVRPGIPKGLVAIVTKMMAKDPAERYQTPKEVAEALLPWIHAGDEKPPADLVFPPSPPEMASSPTPPALELPQALAEEIPPWHQAEEEQVAAEDSDNVWQAIAQPRSPTPPQQPPQPLQPTPPRAVTAPAPAPKKAAKPLPPAVAPPKPETRAEVDVRQAAAQSRSTVSSQAPPPPAPKKTAKPTPPAPSSASPKPESDNEVDVWQAMTQARAPVLPAEPPPPTSKKKAKAPSEGPASVPPKPEPKVEPPKPEAKVEIFDLEPPKEIPKGLPVATAAEVDVELEPEPFPIFAGPTADPDEEESSWGTLTTPSLDATAAKETSEPPPASKAVPARNKRAASPAAVRGKRFWWLVGAGSVLGLLVIATGIWLLSRKDSSSTGDGNKRGQSAELVVSRAGKEGTFKTLAAALSRARPGDHIIVADSMIDEQLDLHDIQDITIEPEANRNVIWGFPKSQADAKQLLTMSNAEGIHVKGFTIDGRDKVDQLILLTGQCPGLSLENIECRGFKRAAILVMNCVGRSDAPVSIMGVHARTASDKDAGIEFGIHPRIVSPRINDFFLIRNCQFEGPFKHSLQGAHDPTMVRDIQIDE